MKSSKYGTRYIAVKETSMTFWHALGFIPGCALFTASLFGFAFKDEILNGRSLVELSVFAAAGILIGIMVAFGMIGETQNLYFDTEKKVMTYTEPLSFTSRDEMYTIGRPQRVFIETYRIPMIRHSQQIFLHIQCGSESSSADHIIQLNGEAEAQNLGAKVARVSGCSFDKAANKFDQSTD
jgi:hypothetical protein